MLKIGYAGEVVRLHPNGRKEVLAEHEEDLK
jgi:hypothetical protein